MGARRSLWKLMGAHGSRWELMGAQQGLGHRKGALFCQKVRFSCIVPSLKACLENVLRLFANSSTACVAKCICVVCWPPMMREFSFVYFHKIYIRCFCCFLQIVKCTQNIK